MSPIPSAGKYEWVELKNRGVSAANMRGLQIADEDGNAYRIPDALPDAPPGARVVVIFDGAGGAGDDYDFSDGAATLHSPPGLVNILEDDADQVALYMRNDFGRSVSLPIVTNNYAPYNPIIPGPPLDFPAPALISFMAWGAGPGSDAALAAAGGAWGADAYVGTAVMPGADPLLPDGSLGVYGDDPVDAVTSWRIFRPGEVSPGTENPLPAPFFRNPASETTTTEHQPTFGWSAVAGATGYLLQIDNDPAFGSPEVAVTVADAQYQPPAPLADGTYYFRAKTLGARESVFSPAYVVTLFTEPALAAEVPAGVAAAQVLLNVTPRLQHKDTLMLDLDGDTETGTARWDSAHETDGDAVAGNGTPVRANNHDGMYCTRASISMIVAYHGGKLSQDRIAFQGYGGGDPTGDLGNGQGMWPNEIKTQGSGKNVFDWAMNGAAVASARGKPTFAQIKSWIDANRPLLVVENNDSHSVVLDGYLESGGRQYAHRVDPWTATKSWVLYSSWRITEHHAPPAGVTPRSDENVDGDSVPDTVDDSDGDGVSDFDEVTRFSLNSQQADSDGDAVKDKDDIREYVFNTAGAYALQNADIDGDGARKELDRDNDYMSNEGSDDGCEDSNLNGKNEPNLAETSNFSPSDDIRLHIRLDWPLFGSDVDLHLVRPGGTFGSVNDTFFANPNPDWGVPGNTCDNPRLDIDCITQCTVENIRLGKLENGMYQIKVHYYWDHDRGPTAPTITVWYLGKQYGFGPRTISDNQIWDVALVGSDGTVTPQNSILLQPAQTSRFERGAGK